MAFEAKSFFRALLVSFSVTALALAGCISFLYRSDFEKYLQPRGSLDSKLAEKISRTSPAWVDPSIHSAAASKKARQFWASSSEFGDGVSLKLLESPALFSSLFPGYPATMAQDGALWDDYFRREFDPATWVSALSGLQPHGVMIHHSWTGCFDIYRRYGADVVILGTSETYRNIAPDLLARELKSPKKILICGTSAMLMDIAKLTADELLKLQAEGAQRPEWVVWGVSLWTGYARSPKFDKTRAQKLALFRNYSAREATASFQLTWDGILPTFGQFKRAVENKRQKLELLASSPESLTHQGRWIASSSSFDPAQSAARAREIAPAYDIFDTISERDCDLAKTDANLSATLASLRKLAHRTLLYVPPTTDLQTRAAPECFVRGMRELVASKASRDVRVETASLEEYGLNYTHFVYPTELPGADELETNHTNYRGAELVTRRIAQILQTGNSDANQAAK